MNPHRQTDCYKFLIEFLLTAVRCTSFKNDTVYLIHGENYECHSIIQNFSAVYIAAAAAAMVHLALPHFDLN